MRFDIRRHGKLAAASILLCSAISYAQVSVTTFHNDNSQTGQNNQETILTPANVNVNTFGKLFTVALDGAVYAQPLVLANVTINGATHNVAYAFTEHDSVYAVDADTGTLYWQKSLIPAGGTTVNATTDLACGDIKLEIGITGTPVIDPTTNTLYVVAKSKVNGVILQYVHALNVATGAEKFGGPTQIQTSVPGTASDGDGTTVTFDARQENQRAGLMLENGHVIVSYASHCDTSPWHGWMLSYSASTLALEATWNASANGNGSGIWFSGGAPSADAAGNIYVATGNGSWNGTSNLGDSIVKLGPPANGTFPVLDYFTPYNQGHMQQVDDDLGSGGMILLPKLPSGKQLLVLIGKEGTLYLVDSSNLGKYCINESPACTNTDPQIVQRIPEEMSGIWGGPAYFNGHLYWAGSNDQTRVAQPLNSFSFGPNAQGIGQVSTTPVSSSVETFNFSGPYPVISSNGTSNGIVWGLDNRYYGDGCTAVANCQVLYAYDATDLNNLLYTSSQAGTLAQVPGGAVKFTAVAVANGKVYVPSQSALSVYGLLDKTVTTAAVPTFTPATGTYTTTQSVKIVDSTAGAVIYYTLDGSTPTTTSAKYTTALSVASTLTVKALAVAAGFANSPVASANYSISGAGSTSTAVSLTAAANIYGIVNNGSSVLNGGMDGLGNSLSANLLGSSVTWGSTTFTLGSAGVADAVSNTTITLAAGSYSTLNLLATGVRGNQANQNFIVTYTDGTTTTVQQSLSDWYTPQGYPGESTAVTMAYRVTGTPGTIQNDGPLYLYGYSFAINAAKTVKSLTLPANRDVVVLAVTLGGGTKTPPPSATGAVSLTSVANTYGLFTDGSAVSNGGMDGLGYAYSQTLLGSTVTWSNTTFSLGAAGVADAVHSTTVPLPAGNFTTLQLLATAVRGNAPNQIFTVTYTDGTSTTITQSLSDWYTPQNYAGESTASTMSYRLMPNGTKQAETFYLYGYSFTLNSAKTVQSVTLPNSRYVVVLAASLSSTTVSAPLGPVSVPLGAGAAVYGIDANGSPVTAGGLDGLGSAYSATLLGTSQTISGVPYALLAAGQPNVISNSTVTLSAGRFSTLKMLATGFRGAQANQAVVVTYTDGTTTTFTQSFSDWYTPSGYGGESTAISMAYRLTATGAIDARTFKLYGYSFALNNAKTVKSMTLPVDTHVGVLAITLVP